MGRAEVERRLSEVPAARPAGGRQGAPEQSRQESSHSVAMATVTMEGLSPASPRQRRRAGQRLPRQEEPEPGARARCFQLGWGRQRRGQSRRAPALRTDTPSSRAPPPGARNRWKDRRTDTPRHSTCITYCPRWVPLVDGVLKVGPKLIKGYDLGEGVRLSGLEQQRTAPHPSLCGAVTHTWGPDQTQLAAKGEKQAQGGAGSGPGQTVWNGTQRCPVQAMSTMSPAPTPRMVSSLASPVPSTGVPEAWKSWDCIPGRSGLQGRGRTRSGCLTQRGVRQDSGVCLLNKWGGGGAV